MKTNIFNAIKNSIASENKYLLNDASEFLQNYFGFKEIKIDELSNYFNYLKNKDLEDIVEGGFYTDNYKILIIENFKLLENKLSNYHNSHSALILFADKNFICCGSFYLSNYGSTELLDEAIKILTKK